MQRGRLLRCRLRCRLLVAMRHWPLHDDRPGRLNSPYWSVRPKGSGPANLRLSSHLVALFHRGRDAHRRKVQASIQNLKCQEGAKASRTAMCKIKGGGTAARKNPVCTLGWYGTAFFGPCHASSTPLIQRHISRAVYDEIRWIRDARRRRRNLFEDDGRIRL